MLSIQNETGLNIESDEDILNNFENAQQESERIGILLNEIDTEISNKIQSLAFNYNGNRDLLIRKLKGEANKSFLKFIKN